MPARSSATRYGSVAIAIHWLTALLIVLLFVTGLSAAGQADESAKIALLRVHVPLGITVLLLTLFRIVWWLVADPHRPAIPADRPGWQKAMATAVHVGLYLVILVSATSGIATIVLSGALPAIIAGMALPDFNTVLPRTVHGAAFRIMLVLLALHVGAALCHQFIRRDHLMARIGLGGARSRGARLRRTLAPVIGQRQSQGVAHSVLVDAV